MATQIVEIDESTNETTGFDPKVSREMHTLMVTVDENSGNIDVLATVDEDETPVFAKIYLKAFDKDTKKWVDDAETAKLAEQTVQDVFGTTIEKLLENNEQIPFMGYTDGNIARFNAFAPLVKFDTVTPRDVKRLRRMSAEDFKPLPIIDDARWNRFALGFSCEIDGEIKKFRVAQVLIESDDDDTPDTTLSLKYESKMIANVYRQLNEGSKLPLALRQKVIEKLKHLTENERAKRVQEINRVLNIDLDSMIEQGQAISFDNVDVTPTPDGKHHYLVGTVTQA